MMDLFVFSPFSFPLAFLQCILVCMLFVLKRLQQLLIPHCYILLYNPLIVAPRFQVNVTEAPLNKRGFKFGLIQSDNTLHLLRHM